MNAYSLHTDSPRWWWPHAATAGLGLAAITTILMLPTTSLAVPGQTTPNAPGLYPQHSAPLFGTDSDNLRPCFMTRARWNIALDHPQPRCAHTNTLPSWTGTPRPDLTTGP